MSEIGKKREDEITKLKDLINDVKKAVDQSAFGPIFIYPDPTNPIEKQANQIAWTLYLHLISPLMMQATQTDKKAS